MLLVVTFVGFLASFAQAARILGVFPFPSYSHQVVFRALTNELSRRGHNVTVFTTDPQHDPTLVNLTEFDIGHLYDGYRALMKNVVQKNEDIWTTKRNIEIYSARMADETFSHPGLQKLIRLNATRPFDLILVQCLFTDALYALSFIFNAPMIGVSSMPMLSVHHFIFGNPMQPSYMPDVLLGYTDHMTFWQRVWNLYYHVRVINDWWTFVLPLQQKVLKKHFGDIIPPSHMLSANLSMLLVNIHPFQTYPHPLVPSIVMIGGLRINRSTKPLPEEIKKILDGAKNGFIYFSLGSNMKSENLPRETQETLLSIFAELPYTVLWKFEAPKPPYKPDNVIIRKWWPQEQILAHPNALLFIYQGGLQSTEEAIYNGVPVIGFPLFSDQTFNVNRLVSLGCGKVFNIREMDGPAVRDGITEVISNSSYRRNMLKFRDLLLDTPEDPMESAIWWVEHVIRHKGAPHLRSKSRDLPWYEVAMLDIFAFFLLLLIIATYVIIFVFRSLWRIYRRIFPSIIRNNMEETKKKL